MTMETTQEEWAAIIDEAEQNVSSTSKVYKAPSIGSTAFAKTIDHTLLKLEATAEQIDTLCKEAVENDFKVRIVSGQRRDRSDFFPPESLGRGWQLDC